MDLQSLSLVRLGLVIGFVERSGNTDRLGTRQDRCRRSKFCFGLRQLAAVALEGLWQCRERAAVPRLPSIIEVISELTD